MSPDRTTGKIDDMKHAPQEKLQMYIYNVAKYP